MFCKLANPNSVPGSHNINCMMCLSVFSHDKIFCQSVDESLAEILSDIFKVLCIYMKWAPSSKFQYNFSNDVFPFCKECRLLVVKMYKYDKLLLEIQQQIDTLASHISAKILESQNDQGLLQPTQSTEISSGQYLTHVVSASEKAGYYRSSICNRYSPSVRLISEPTLLQTESGIEVAEDDLCQSESEHSQRNIIYPDNDENIDDISVNNDDGQEEATHLEKDNFDILDIESSIEVKQTIKTKIKPVYLEVEPNKYLYKEKYPFEFKDDKYNCWTCPSEFSTRSQILLHIKTEHVTYPENWVCKICGNVYLSNEAFKHHLPKHKNDRPFKCEICGNSFKFRSSLTDHKAKKHLVCDKKHKCKVCGRIFGLIGQLRQHEKSHKYCTCHVCGKNIQLKGFNKHLHTHEQGEGKFECKKCFKKFRHINVLYAHLKSHDVTKQTIKDERKDADDDITDISTNKDHEREEVPYTKNENSDTLGTESRIEVEDVLCDSDSKNNPTSSNFPANDEGAEDATSVNLEGRAEEELHIANLNTFGTEKSKEDSKDDLFHDFENIKRPRKRRPYNKIGPEPFPSLGDRVTIVGDHQFLLDDKCLFECSETQFKCISCDLLFEDKYGLKKHLNYCPGNPSDDVIKTYKYRVHAYDKIASGKLRCRKCKYLCQSRDTMISHMRKFHTIRRILKDKIKPLYFEKEPNKFLCNQKYPFEMKDEKFNCGTCASDFSTRSEVLSHIQREHIWADVKKMVKFKKISPEKFVWTDPFNNSYSFEKVGNTYKCNGCSYSNSNLKCMKDHVKCIHIDEGSSTCNICGKVFNSMTNLKLHLRTHKDDRPFVCELCGQSYKCFESMKNHKAEKHPEIFEEKYECEVCGRVLGSVYCLREHEKRHEYSVCHVCGKNIKRLHINTHLITHEPGEGKYECKKCFKKFKHRTGLYIHLKSHDGAKPFSCDICGMKFTQSYSVTRHKNVVHNSNKATKPSGKVRKRKPQPNASSDEEEFEETFEENESEDENIETSSSANEGDD